MFREIRERIQQGTNLADALEEHPAYFSELYVNMVRAGQAAGNLDIVLARLADLRLADPDAPLPRRRGNFVLGIESLPVEFTPGRPRG